MNVNVNVSIKDTGFANYTVDSEMGQYVFGINWHHYAVYYNFSRSFLSTCLQFFNIFLAI